MPTTIDPLCNTHITVMVEIKVWRPATMVGTATSRTITWYLEVLSLQNIVISLVISFFRPLLPQALSPIAFILWCPVSKLEPVAHLSMSGDTNGSFVCLRPCLPQLRGTPGLGLPAVLSHVDSSHMSLKLKASYKHPEYFSILKDPVREEVQQR